VNRRMLTEILKAVQLQGHQLCTVDLKLWTIYQEYLVSVSRCVTLDTAPGLLR